MADVEPQLLSETLEANKTANAFFDIERPQFLLKSFLKPPGWVFFNLSISSSGYCSARKIVGFACWDGTKRYELKSGLTTSGRTESWHQDAKIFDISLGGRATLRDATRKRMV